MIRPCCPRFVCYDIGVVDAVVDAGVVVVVVVFVEMFVVGGLGVFAAAVVAVVLGGGYICRGCPCC